MKRREKIEYYWITLACDNARCNDVQIITKREARPKECLLGCGGKYVMDKSLMGLANRTFPNLRPKQRKLKKVKLKARFGP